MYTYTRPQLKPKDDDYIYMVDESSYMKSFDHDKIYRTREFNEAMKYFDMSDDMSRNILLSVNEADQNSIMTSLSNKLYEMIVDKIDEIDFGSIPQSKGDITKIENYQELTDCINIIGEILQQYHQDTASVETVSMAITNIEERKELFTKAYALNVEFPIIIYNTMTLSVVASVSYLIASIIEFVKAPDDSGFEIALNKIAASRSRESLLYHDLEKFNNMCANGTIDKSMDYVIKGNAKNFTGGVIFGGSVAVVLGFILLIIPVIRELIFFFYWSRVKVSDYFDLQYALLTQNAYNIENNLTMDAKTKKEIVGKQKKIADKFKKIANYLRVSVKTGEVKAEKEIKEIDNNKYKTSDVIDNVPASSNSALF